ncbi:N-acetyl sugar amidotransferase [Rosistilla oblonga]|uniref:N-acetyl sugar amidotransferase n=1 Tax=Rosistilla oblonga TaxID=2527990 RepID=UPI003A988230
MTVSTTVPSEFVAANRTALRNTSRKQQTVEMNGYRICEQCVMDTTDTAITFDDEGICDHCHSVQEHVRPNWHTDQRGRDELARIVERIKHDGRKRDFDCIMGMSGGADSSYLLHVAVKDFGLRPLVFHVDGGWNSQLAVHNIEKMIDGLGLDLFTEVIDWEEMKDFQLSYFKSGLPNIDVPQDHAFIATLYNFADKHKIGYILNGGNYSTECVRNPLEFFYHGTDMAQIRDVHSRFGTRKLKKYPFSSILRHKFYLRYVRRIQVVKPLNYVPYIKADAMQELADLYDWTPYPQKHFESRFTRFYEGYWLPKKFGFDSRRVQFSSLILTDQMTREAALEELAKPAISDEDARNEFDYVAKKLGISTEELQGYFDQPNRSHRDYKNQEAMFQAGSKLLNWFGIERNVKR